MYSTQLSDKISPKSMQSIGKMLTITKNSI